MNSKRWLAGSMVAFLCALVGGCSIDGASKQRVSSRKEGNNFSGVEVVSTASVNDKPEVIEKALGSEGYWFVAITDDITFDKELTISGEFHDKGQESAAIYRVFALYSKDPNNKVTAQYTLTVPRLIVKSENVNIVNGIINGDILIKENGFVLDGTKVDGKIIFEKETYQKSATLDKDGGEVIGKVSVK